ncbi:MAG: hypothetical protein KGQ59_10040 [Bdellovibrionales bacterium]|nr:hypothetical protein [Bdellovibrionales bacterium]
MTNHRTLRVYLGRSLVTQFFSISALLIAGSFWRTEAEAGPIINNAQREHENDERVMEQIHDEMNQSLDDYYKTLKDPKSSPEKLDKIRKGMDESSRKIGIIHQQAHERLNRVTESLVYRSSDGQIVEVDPNQKEDQNKGNSEKPQGMAQKPGTASGQTPQAVSQGQQRRIILEPSSSNPPPTDEIRDAHAPEEYIFKKKGSKSPSP